MADEIRIAELQERLNIDDSDLMIIEDGTDTKRSTISELKKAFNGDNTDPSTNKFYSSNKVDSIIRNVSMQINVKTDTDVSDLQDQLTNLLTTTSKTPLPKGNVMFDLSPGREAIYTDWFGGTWECIGNVDLGVANHTVLLYIYQKTEGIDYPDSSCTLEIVAARGEYDSLADRFTNERKISDAKYMQYPTINQTNNIAAILNKGKNIQATLIFKGLATKSFTFTKRTVNLFDCVNCGGDPGVTPESTGFSVFMKTTGLKSFKIKISDSVLDAGTYYIYHSMDAKNGATGFTYDIVYTDDTFDTISPRMNMEILELVARKPFKYIRINVIGTFSSTPIGDSTQYLIKFKGFMITQYNKLTNYSQYYIETVSHAAVTTEGDAIFSYICPYDTIFSSSEDFTLSYVDTSYSESTVTDIIDDVNNSTDKKTDHCGLMEDYGTYIYLDSIASTDSDIGSIVSDKTKSRNYNPSAKITIKDYVSGKSPTFIRSLDSITSFESVGYITLQVYIDRPLYSNFYENKGIEIIVSSDKPTIDPVNYYSYNIGKAKFVQGWNNIKIKFSDFTKSGAPDIRSIRQFRFVIATNNLTAGHTLWLNSIILDQRMTPTVLFAFDGTYESGFDYQYPLMYSKEIPATIFMNDRDTWTKDFMNKLCTLQYQYGWDIGDYGCNPDKELLIKDDNPREQYLALKSAKNYIVDNYVDDPISYSASFGNLRPITVPILKSLGFKIAKTESDALCSFFSDDDFAMPMCLLSNVTTSDKVIAKIDEAVESGQCVVIYTNNVTEYGDDIAASKTSFEKVLSHVEKLNENKKIQCLTFKDFYRKCISK